jgi:hypothetical protein
MFWLGKSSSAWVSGHSEARLGPPGAVHGFHNPGPGRAKLLILIYPADGLGLVEDLPSLFASSAEAPDSAAIRAVYTKYGSELV